MSKFLGTQIIPVAVLSGALLLSSTGCQQLPGTSGEQGAAIGGVGGAATGALVGGEHHRLLGALLGGAVGAGGGYLIGANKDKILGHDTGSAEAAARNAQAHPATPQEALNATTADLNGDGFVTMDEVAAMRRAGFSDQQILQRMQATGQVFELTPEQQAYLRSNGVDDYVIGQIPQLNRQVRDSLLGQSAAPPTTAPAPTYQQPYNSPPPSAPNYQTPPNYPAAPTYQPPPAAPAPANPLTTPVPPPPGP